MLSTFTILLITIGFLLSIGVIILRNPVSALVCLIGVFFCGTVILLIAGVEFLAYLYILVYVGAVAVLFLFVIMLLNLRRSSTLRKPLFIQLLVAILFFCILNNISNYLLSELLKSSVAYEGSLDSVLQYCVVDYFNSVQFDPVLHTPRVLISPELVKTYNSAVLHNDNLRLFGQCLYGNYWVAVLLIAVIFIIPLLGAVVFTYSSRFKHKYMSITLWTFGVTLMFIGLIGLILQNKQLLGFIMVIEIILLGLSFQFIAISSFFGDITGQVFAFFIMAIAAAESAVGLGLLIMSNQVIGDLDFKMYTRLRG
jgi:NADH:ubiquinone oxidoreductase subunit K/NADH:ubiquinone oxidoreductase subunit 6 (subunit J)